MQMDVTTDALIAITILWGFVFIYAVMASMDFGAGFWSMIYMNREQTKAANIANKYLSPTWEVTNVFIVAIVVALFSLFRCDLCTWYRFINTRQHHIVTSCTAKRVSRVFSFTP